MKIQLPWPDAKLNPNRSKGMHWAATSKLRSQAKIDAFHLALQAASSNFCKVLHIRENGCALSITFVQPDKRARDRDNLLAALKPSLDGIAAALGVDDSLFDPITIRREYGAKPGCVLVEVVSAV
jgi:crossover junction endodeoxyribonuclease RusA